MIRNIILFVLVIMMVKTNAQTNPWLSLESNDKMLIRLYNQATQQDVNDLLTKISADPNFTTATTGGAYFILDRKSGSTITRQQAINYYINESYIGSVNFVYDVQPDETFFAMTHDIIVRGKSTTTQADIITAATTYGLTDIKELATELNTHILYFDKYTDLFQVMYDLDQTGLFEYEQINTVYTKGLLSIGLATTSSGNCHSPLSYDTHMADYLNWGLYTGSTANFNSVVMPSIGQEYSDINICHAWYFRNGSVPLGGATVNIDGNSTLLGRPVYIAVVDDGVDTRHVDLPIRRKSNGISAYGFDAAEFTNPNPTILRSNPLYPNNPNYPPSAPDDLGCPDKSNTNSNMHGTIVAGIAAAKRNLIGSAGAASGAQIMPVHGTWVTDPNSSVVMFDAATMAAGVHWAAVEGADVINNSWGFYHTGYFTRVLSGAKAIEDEFAYAVSTGRAGKGCVLVNAAGNDDDAHLSYPSSNPNCIAVGMMSPCHERVSNGIIQSCILASFGGSNYGDGLTQYYATGQALLTSGRLSVMAPGTRVVSTVPGNRYLSTTLLAWDYGTGTSMAAPFVSGIAALAISVNPCLTYTEVRDVIEKGADRVQPSSGSMAVSYTYSNPGLSDPNGTWNNQMGHGKANAGNTVTLAYDLYKQDMTEVGTKTYRSSHNIYAGLNVTDILPNTGTGLYVVPSQNARITFNAPLSQSVNLMPGFQASSTSLANSSVFIAETSNLGCNNSDRHYKSIPNEFKYGPSKHISSGKQSQLNNIRDVSIYPNPVEDMLNISFVLEDGDNVVFSVSNLLGQTAVNSQSETYGTSGKYVKSISMKGLVSGVYTVTVNTSLGITQVKFVKQ